MSSLPLGSSSEKASSILSTCEVDYNLRIRHPERTEIYADYSDQSAHTRSQPTAMLDVSYGLKPNSTVDLFMPQDVASPPLLIFIHGGYWRALDKENFSFIADEYVSRGIAVAIPNYELAPSATVIEIVEQVRDAVVWLKNNGTTLGYDASRIVISGHSAGGHMAAKISCQEFTPEIAGSLLGYVGLSALFELEPLLYTSVNFDLNMTTDDARSLSLYRESTLFDIPVVLAVGEHETVGFLRQSLDYSTYLAQAGYDVSNLKMPQRNHFDLLADFAGCSDTGNLLFRKTLAMFGTHP